MKLSSFALLCSLLLHLSVRVYTGEKVGRGERKPTRMRGGRM